MVPAGIICLFALKIYEKIPRMQHVENRVEKLSLYRQKSEKNFGGIEIFFEKTRAKLHKKWYNKYQSWGSFRIPQRTEISLGAGGVCMYLHLGQDVVVPASSILGVYDMDTATWSKHTRALIASMEKAGRVQSIFEDLPKSCILCEEGGVRTLYISQLSTATLLRRSEQGAAE